MTKEIPLTRGLVALVDDEDYERVSALKWSAVHTTAGYWYARHAWHRDGKWGHIKMHRFILDCSENVKIDHINRNPLDNRRENLRIATQQQNVRNTKGYGATGFKGVTKSKRLYRAQINRGDDGYVLLGLYKSAEDAARVYDAAAYLLDPEFHYRNFPDIDPAAMEIATAVLNGAKPSDLFQNLHPARKLTDDDVAELRRRYSNGGILMRDLADEYGVCVASVQHAISGRTFRHITSPPPIKEDKRRKAA